MPSFTSYVRSLTQAIHLPTAILWCWYRAFTSLSPAPITFDWILQGIAFVIPTYRYREQLSGGWFSRTAPQEQAPGPRGRNEVKRYGMVPLLSMARNVCLIVLYSEFMSDAANWIHRGITPRYGFEYVLNWIDYFIWKTPITNNYVRLMACAGVAYVGCYGGLGYAFGEALRGVKVFMLNWKKSAADMDAEREAQNE